jgi:hypothetical protein
MRDDPVVGVFSMLHELYQMDTRFRASRSVLIALVRDQGAQMALDHYAFWHF